MICAAILSAVTLLGSSPSTAWAGSIFGVVTNGSTAAPIQGVQVSASREASPNRWEGVAGFTDANGHYTLSGLPEGDYEVEFSPYEENYVAEYYDGQRSEEDADLVHLGEGESLAGIDASLAVGGEITGQVLSAVGAKPIEGVWACAYSQTSFTGGCDKTGAAGNYTIKALPTDSYAVDFDPRWSVNYFGRWYEAAESWEQAEWVPVAEGSVTPGIDGALDEAAGITGTVTDAKTGWPREGIEVCALEVGGEEFSRCSRTSEDGRYVVGGMPSGEYKVVFSPERAGDEEEASKVDDGYLAQYYDDAATRAAATVLALTAPSLTTGIDAKLTSNSVPIGWWLPEGTPERQPSARNRPNTVIFPPGIRIRRHSATFKLLPKPPGSWFECRIDRHPYRRCSSPVTYRHLRPGRHLFEARTVPKVGTAGPPARFKFKIKPRPRRR